MIGSLELGQLAPFASLPRDELLALAAVAQSTDHRHGACLFREGEACRGVSVVSFGFVWLSRLNPAGAKVTTGVVGPGGLAAVSPLRGEAEHDADAVALGRVRAIEIPTAVLFSLLSRSPHLFAELSHGLATRRDEAFAATMVAAQGHLLEQILHMLRHLARPRSAGTEDAMRRLAVRLTHAEVARLVGADRVSVTRSLHLLEMRGLIQRECGHITSVAATTSADAHIGRGRLHSGEG